MSSGLGWPNDVTIDYTARKIFWIDSKLDKIETSDYNGNNRAKLFEYNGIHPLSITFYNSLLYWSDWATTHGFHSFDTTNNQVQSLKVIGNQLMGVAVFDQSIQPSGKIICYTKIRLCQRYGRTKQQID